MNFAALRDIVISSTCFPKNNIHKKTRVLSYGRTYNQIDYLAIDKEHRSWIKKNIHKFGGSDDDTNHYIVEVRKKI